MRRALPTALLLLALALLPLAAPPRVQAADAGLVLEALGHLQTRYVDAVNPVGLLNGAIGGLRGALSAAGVKANLADITAGVGSRQVETLFRGRFDAAVGAASGRVSTTALAYAAIRGMTATLNDSHTGFITPEQNRERQLRQQGQAGFSGAGIVLMPREGRYYVRDVIPGSPAQAAGVRQFDRIVRIGTVPTTGLPVDGVAGLIRGPAGTSVSIVVERPGQPDQITITLRRAPIQVPAVFQATVRDGGIGYLQFYQFVERSGRDFRDGLRQMLVGGMKALVLDLRANNGGYIHELSSALNAALPPGRPVIQETNRGGRKQIIRTSGAPLLPAAMPIVVLIDEGTASAAELMAAALQEHGRATLLGMKTSGAVEASILLNLSDGSALSVTVQRLTTGLGRRLENVGVAVDVQVPQPLALLDQGRDHQLEQAMALARQRLGVAQPAVRPPSGVGNTR
ncbi:MAG: PDZ domain-containing protein [Armatimonadetes bacterium]|nr:PDZ domain-containing protein [Armatimonadota bacterium]